MDKLPYGLYESLHTGELQRLLEKAGQLELAEWKEYEIEELVQFVSVPLARSITSHYAEYLQKNKKANRLSVESYLRMLDEENELHQILNRVLPIKNEVLHELKLFTGSKPKVRPDTPLSVSALFTGASRTPTLISQLRKELESCDRAEWLVSFIKLSGLNPLLPALRKFTSTPLPDGNPRLKIATTSYMGATDIKAIERLKELANTEIRFSLDTQRTRLHAKAFLFHRLSGYGTAYIGSANISQAALHEGLEWTAKVSQYETPHLWDHVISAFDSHWEDEKEFTPCTQTSFQDFKSSIQNERKRAQQPEIIPLFKLTPHVFQQKILDDIAAERESGKNRHLIISATGTGKTMVAAFDYEQFAKESGGGWPTILYIAHREEILKQAHMSFRQVLGDSAGDFGELLAGNTSPADFTHLFCTIQSWNARRLYELPAEYFAYVVLDEAHHGPAESYQRLIKHINPQSLLGLTATPERADGNNVRDDFDGMYTHELRLTEAVERALLTPFHYYGIPDYPDVDLSAVKWSRGKYDQSQLNSILAENDGRADWVLRETDTYIADLRDVRGLGFCVSKVHAEYMAVKFTKAHIPSEALTSDSDSAVRLTVLRRLQQREINFIFTVDLFNEGIDIPFADTLLFLRPTESLTIFLQQLGRGLRLYKEKSHVTVLDFVAPQRREFDFVSRFRNLSMKPGDRIDRQIEAGMPFVPTGCFIHLEKKVQDIVLDNISISVNRLKRKRFITEFRHMVSQLGEGIGLDEMMGWFHLDNPDPIYKIGLPSDLKAFISGDELQKSAMTEGSFELSSGFRKLLLLDDTHLFEDFSRYVSGEEKPDVRKLNLFHSTLWKQDNNKHTTRPGNRSLQSVDGYLSAHPGLRNDLLELFSWLLSHTPPAKKQTYSSTGDLRLHASYSRDQIFTLLGLGTFEKRIVTQAGVHHFPQKRSDLFFVDINKDAADFSPTTMYDDYAITDRKFHWQSQSATSETSPTGLRYIHHQDKGYTPYLFFRERNKSPNGMTNPYFFAGPVKYVRHEGSKPMSITWELAVPLPARVLEWARRAG